MDLPSVLVRHVTYPLWMLKDRRTFIRVHDDFDRRSLNELRASQFVKLKQILTYAYNHTTYHRRIFDQVGFSPTDFRHPIELMGLPITTKEDIRNHLLDMVSSVVATKDLIQDSTGGSTGTPMVFYRDTDCFLRRRAQELFFDHWMGYQVGDKMAYLVSFSHCPKKLSSIKAKTRNATCERMLAFDPHEITDEYMAFFTKRFRAFKPKIIKCFPNSLYVFGDFLRRQGIEDLSAQAISCTGETLYDYQRTLMESVFKCKVFDKYGTRESGVIACECSGHDGMHIFTDGAYLEFIKDGRKAKPGELADILVTDLMNHGMPLIRYKIGDVGTYTERQCSCGSTLPRIGKLLGRDRDILIAADGNPKPGYLFVEVINKNNIPGKFQVIQESFETVKVKIVRMPGFKLFYLDLMAKEFNQILGGKVQIDFEFVSEIPRTPSGKYRYTYSKISRYHRQQNEDSEGLLPAA